MLNEDQWDGDWVLFSMDTATGVERWYNPKENLFKTISHADKILKENKERRAEASGKRWGDGQSVASVPLELFYRELNQAVEQQDNKYLLKWLNNSDNQAFRTREGKI